MQSACFVLLNYHTRAQAPCQGGKWENSSAPVRSGRSVKIFRPGRIFPAAGGKNIPVLSRAKGGVGMQSERENQNQRGSQNQNQNQRENKSEQRNQKENRK